MRGARLAATHPDRTCPVPGGMVADTAGMIAAVEAVSGKRCEAVTGKPSPWTINIALGKLNVPKEAAIMVGDRLETDMRMGIDAGIATALVLTGITKRTDLAASPIQPTFVLETLRDLL